MKDRPAWSMIRGALDRGEVAPGERLVEATSGSTDNWRAHYRTTGPEIWRDTDGAVTHFVSAMGTTGTIMGTSRYLSSDLFADDPAVHSLLERSTSG